MKQNKLLLLCKVSTNQTLTHQLRHQQNFYFRQETDAERASVSLELEILLEILEILHRAFTVTHGHFAGQQA